MEEGEDFSVLYYEVVYTREVLVFFIILMKSVRIGDEPGRY